MVFGDETKCFTVTWKIDNFGKCFLPMFQPNTTITWKNLLRSSVWNMENSEDSALFRLTAIESPAQLQFALVSLKGELKDKDYRYEMSILMSSGEVQLNRQLSHYTCCYGIDKQLFFGRNSDLFLPQGKEPLTLCCRIWQPKLKPGRYLLQSALHEVNFPWIVEGFNFHSCPTKRLLYQQETMLISLSLIKLNGALNGVNVTHQVRVELLPASGRVSFTNSSISIKGELGHLISRNSTSSEVSWNIALNSEECKDSLHLEFKTIVSLDFEHQLLPTSCKTLSEDFLLLYKKGTLSDVTLNTEGTSFPAHKNILATRSPVFHAMFEKDRMVEGLSGFVDIDDINSKTMDRFLVFLYGGLIENLQWEEALALYYAADKYEVLTLKQKCAEILKVGLTADNVCDALCLADKHSDEQLMSYAVALIRDHKDVISSSAWESLEESNARLTSKVLRQVLLKKRRVDVYQ